MNAYLQSVLRRGGVIVVALSPLALGVGFAAESSLQDLADQLKAQSATIERQQQQIDALLGQAEHAAASREGESGKLRWQGYGVINYQRYDFYENAQDNSARSRARTDLERIILAPEYDFGGGISFVAEIEFEHGGTGSTVEFEPEEAGEFEVEIEKGGEVVLEQAHLKIERNPALNWRIGEIVVPFGMVNSHHEPSQYFTLERSLSETTLIPSTWHETGVELYGSLGQFRYQAQLVSSLDSSGFSGYGFVSAGQQGKLEFRNADDLALLARLDYAPLPGIMVGGALYYGDSAGNRPRQNLNVSAVVSLMELHGRYERGPLTVRGQYFCGEIDNADRVTQANFTTFNAGTLGVSKTPVGSRAEAWFIEAGYDLFALFDGMKGRLDAFARYETYDSHADTAGTIVRNPRYEREATTFGVNYKPRPGIVVKGEYSHRTHAGAVGNEQDFVGVGVGFEF